MSSNGRLNKFDRTNLAGGTPAVSMVAATDHGSALPEPKANCPAKPDIMAPGAELGGYRLVGAAPLGRGGFGEVWRAEEKMTGVRCALKVVPKGPHSDVELQGIRDYRIHARGHQHLVQVFHVGETESLLYYAMELADCYPASADNVYQPRSLASDLARRHRLPVQDAVPPILNVLGALAHLHESGLLHRDVKPGNVLVVNGVWKLADVGLVAHGAHFENNAHTPGYAPPGGIKDRMGDLFAVGKTLFELLAGTPPDRFPSIPNDLTRAERLALAPLNAVVDRACDPDPARRFQTATDMRRAVEQCSIGPATRHRRRFAFASIVLSALALFCGLTWNWMNRSAPPVRGLVDPPTRLQVYGQGQSDFSHLETNDLVRFEASLPSEYHPLAFWIDAGNKFTDLTEMLELQPQGSQTVIKYPAPAKNFGKDCVFLEEPIGTEVIVLIGSKRSTPDVEAAQRLRPESGPPPLRENIRIRAQNGIVEVEGRLRGPGKAVNSSEADLRAYLKALHELLSTEFDYVEIVAFRHVAKAPSRSLPEPSSSQQPFDGAQPR